MAVPLSPIRFVWPSSEISPGKASGSVTSSDHARRLFAALLAVAGVGGVQADTTRLLAERVAELLGTRRLRAGTPMLSIVRVQRPGVTLAKVTCPLESLSPRRAVPPVAAVGLSRTTRLGAE